MKKSYTFDETLKKREAEKNEMHAKAIKKQRKAFDRATKKLYKRGGKVYLPSRLYVSNALQDYASAMGYVILPDNNKNRFYISQSNER